VSKEFWLYGTAVMSGVGAWVLVSVVSGQREAWDSERYLLIGMPVVCVVSAGLSFVEPTRPWRWGLAPILAQAVWMFTTQGFGNLWPLGMVAFLVLAIPSILSAWFGAFLRKRARHVQL